MSGEQDQLSWQLGMLCHDGGGSGVANKGGGVLGIHGLSNGPHSPVQR